MITGTLLVAVLYIGLNMMFLYAAPIHELVVDVKTFEPTDLAVVVAGHILPSNLVFVMQGIVCLLLLSSMSSMILAGPRITAAIAEQYSVLQLLAKRSSKGIPLYAIGLQTIVAVILFVSNSFEDTLKFTAMMLTLSSMATVGSILRIERKMLTMIASIVFLAANTWVVIHVSQDNPTSIVWTAVIIFLGIVLYAMLSLSRNRS
jgi:APA family basic amino acid/polyamine antiporter